MVHAIKKYENKKYGNHITSCDKVLKHNEEYSLSLEKVTCPKCRVILINRIVSGINNKIEISRSVGDEAAVRKFQMEKEKYSSYFNIQLV